METSEYQNVCIKNGKNAIEFITDGKVHVSVFQIEQSVKTYFENMLGMILETLRVLRSDGLHYRAMDKNNYAKINCPRILQTVDQFMEIMNMYAISTEELEATDFDLTKSAHCYLKTIDDSFTLRYGYRLYQADNFVALFFAERQNKTTVSGLLSSIRGINLELENFKIKPFVKLLRGLWFRLRISRFYTSCVQTYYLEQEKPIMQIREVYDKLTKERADHSK